MFTVATNEFRLPEPIEVKFFRSLEHFLLKARKHFLADEEVWERLLGVKKIKKFSKKLADESVDDAEVQSFYDRVVGEITRGIQFAEALPLYVAAEEKVEFESSRNFTRRVLYLLAEPGFRIVIYGGVVRTAFFATAANESYYTLFREGWRAIRARVLVKKKYRREDSTATTEICDREWFNDDHWSKCPTPHQRPPRSLKTPDGQQGWLDELNETFGV